MPLQYDDIYRRVVPRWRASDHTTSSGELASLRKPPNLPDRTARLQQVLDDFRRVPTLSTAADVLGAAIVFNATDLAIGAADFVLNKGLLATAASVKLANHVLKLPANPPSESESTRSEIARLRRGLHLDPRNAIRWLDLARAYTLLGQPHKAEVAVTRALALAPAHRYIARSAARFYLHRGQPDRAHHLLISTPTTALDPWILAAEAAVASVLHKDPEFYRDSKDVLRNCSFAPRHLSELASAIGTLELTNGSTKRARKLFRLALEEPTENSVAQARWATNIDGGIQVEDRHFEDPLSREARAWYFYYAEHWDSALQNFWTWHFDEPYSFKPCATGSFVAAEILGRYGDAADLARSGLTANPGHPLLLNNLAYALILQGRLHEATHVLERFRLSSVPAVDTIALRATTGLLAFRLGYTNLGRNLYRGAIQHATLRDLPELATLAELHLGYEEFRVGNPKAQEHIKAAVDRADTFRSHYFHAVHKRLAALNQQMEFEAFHPLDGDMADLPAILNRNKMFLD